MLPVHWSSSCSMASSLPASSSDYALVESSTSEAYRASVEHSSAPAPSCRREDAREVSEAGLPRQSKLDERQSILEAHAPRASMAEASTLPVHWSSSASLPVEPTRGAARILRWSRLDERQSQLEAQVPRASNVARLTLPRHWPSSCSLATDASSTCSLNTSVRDASSADAPRPSSAPRQSRLDERQSMLEASVPEASNADPSCECGPAHLV